jgi:hypothetical protein
VCDMREAMREQMMSKAMRQHTSLRLRRWREARREARQPRPRCVSDREGKEATDASDVCLTHDTTYTHLCHILGRVRTVGIRQLYLY